MDAERFDRSQLRYSLGADVRMTDWITLSTEINDPLRDSRTPDIIVQPVYGTIYTGASKNKLAEHGGFSFGDTSVAATGPIISVDLPTDAPNPFEAVLGASWTTQRVLLDLDRAAYIDSCAIGWLMSSASAVSAPTDNLARWSSRRIRATYACVSSYGGRPP